MNQSLISNKEIDAYVYRFKLYTMSTQRDKIIKAVYQNNKRSKITFGNRKYGNINNIIQREE